jgi:o-succinylbenzoate synthase
MRYKFNFYLYKRNFVKPLQTSHGIWKIREGIIVSLTDDLGRIGKGEIAPIPWFGSETLEDACKFCQQLGDEITKEQIESIPNGLFACQFGLGSAWENLQSDDRLDRDFHLNYSYLLPTGEAALTHWQSLWEKGGRTFKWKIGVTSLEEEIKIFQQLSEILPETAQLRLDANGGLNLEEAKTWLELTDRTDLVEFVEQPLSPQQFDLMLELSNSYTTAIALDESVANIVQLENCYQKGWRGIYIIKPGILGSPQKLRFFCQQNPIDAVFSSVFETEVGKQAALKLAAELSNHSRAIGFGVKKWFK